MEKSKRTKKDSEIKKLEKHPEVKLPADPEDPFNAPEEDHEILRDEDDLIEPETFEETPPGEGP